MNNPLSVSFCMDLSLTLSLTFFLTLYLTLYLTVLNYFFKWIIGCSVCDWGLKNKTHTHTHKNYQFIISNCVCFILCQNKEEIVSIMSYPIGDRWFWKTICREKNRSYSPVLGHIWPNCWLIRLPKRLISRISITINYNENLNSCCPKKIFLWIPLF